MKPNIWPKLNEIHERWLTSESVVELVKDLLLSIKNDDQDLQKNFNHERVSGTSFYSGSRSQLSVLNTSMTNNNVALSPRPQTPPTNLHPAKSPRSPRRTSSSVDYKNNRTHMKVKGLLSADDSHLGILNQSESKDAIRVNSNIARVSATIDQNRKSLSPKENNKRQNSVQQIKSTPESSMSIPRFFFSKGKPSSNKDNEVILSVIREKLQKLASYDTTISKSKMAEIVKILNVPLYWKQPVYLTCGGKDTKPLKPDDIIHSWRLLMNNCGSEAAKFMHLMTRGGLRNFLTRADFEPLIQDVLDTHPGLQFLQSSVDFHVHYINTVISRIFFNLDRCWNDQITLTEVVKSDLLWTLNYLETHDDINTVTQYFSYEHFYVIYCKFWELDTDHNLIISKEDLAKHNSYALSDRVIDRIFCGTVLRKPTHDKTMTFPEFVWFLLAEEDKRHPRSVEYWFRLMDLDGDGYLSLYELEYFYEEQLLKMEDLGIEPVNFSDCICMMLDMIKPCNGDKIILADLKACKLCHLFFDTFLNLPKYLDHEQRDPFNNLKDIEEGLNEMSDWDRFASEAYEVLVSEDCQQQAGASSEDFAYEDDFENEDGKQNGDVKQNENFNSNFDDLKNNIVEPGFGPVGNGRVVGRLSNWE